jgi:DNA repair protein RadC
MPGALRIIREAAILYLQHAAEQCDSFTDPNALARFWRIKIGLLSHEVFQVGYLDTAYHLLRAK